MILPAAIALAATLTAPQKAAIDALIASTVKSELIAGATVGVSIDGDVAFERSYGYADAAARTPASNETVYPIGSVTKQFTAACVLLLEQDGKLSIDDPLSRYVTGLPWSNRVTLRHLLDQESGIVDFRSGVTDYTTPLKRSEVLDRLAQTDLLFAPGSQYRYSNSNYYLLGMVVERASGKPYAQFLHERVLTPLELASTSYDAASAAIPALARGHTADRNGPQPVASENADWSYAAGALVTTASDLLRWDDAIRDGPLLTAASRLEMFTPGSLDDGSATDYAFGWVAIRHDGVREVWHNGDVTGYHAMNATYPELKTDVVVLTNTGQTFAADKLAVQIFDLIHPYAPTAADRAAAGRAREWLGRLQRGDADRSQLADLLAAQLTPDVMKSVGAQLRGYGAVTSVDVLSVDEDASGRNYSFTLHTAKRPIHCVMGIDVEGKISALAFR